MNQIVHIFRKDVRHYWIEIVSSLALLAAYAWREPRSWSGQHLGDAGLLGVLWGFVTPLVPLAWCFLIVRVVHDESLVGDRQFWVTRPYDWKQLLAAKTLFVAAFINLPLLIVDVILLLRGGFRPGSYVLGLLWMQLLMVLFLVLPTATAATITASIPQVLLAVLAVLLYLISAISLISVIPNYSMSTASSIPGALSVAVLIAGCVAVVLWQYSRRQVWQARGIIVAAAVLMVIIAVATPYGYLAARAYPPSGNGRPAPVVLAPGPAVPLPKVPQVGKGRRVDLPLSVTGLAPGTVVVVDGARFSITAADGGEWDSRWQGSGEQLWPDRDRAGADVEVPMKFFDRVKAAPSNVHISFALTLYREENPRTLKATGGEFRLPDVGICASTRAWEVAHQAVLQCRSPLRSPVYIASIDTSTVTCLPSPSRPPMPQGIRLTAQNLRSPGPADLGISPVQAWPLLFWNWFDPEQRFASLSVCPGTPITVSTPAQVEQLREDVEFDGVQLKDYAPETEVVSGGDGSFFFTFGVH